MRKDMSTRKLNSIKKQANRKIISAGDKKKDQDHIKSSYVKSFSGEIDKKPTEVDVSFGKQDLMKRQNIEFLRDRYKQDNNKIEKQKVLYQSKSERILNDFNSISCKNADRLK